MGIYQVGKRENPYRHKVILTDFVPGVSDKFVLVCVYVSVFVCVLHVMNQVWLNQHYNKVH